MIKSNSIETLTLREMRPIFLLVDSYALEVDNNRVRTAEILGFDLDQLLACDTKLQRTDILTKINIQYLHPSF